MRLASLSFTLWLDDVALPFVCVWLVGWPRYKLGACPACQGESDEVYECEVCKGGSCTMDADVWRRYRKLVF